MPEDSIAQGENNVMNPKEYFFNEVCKTHKMAKENLQLAKYIDDLSTLLSYETFSAEEAEQFSSAIQTLKNVLASRHKELAKQILSLDAKHFE